MRTRTTATRTAVVLVCAALALTACSDDDGGTTAEPTVTATSTDTPEPTATATETDDVDDNDDEGGEDGAGDDCRTSDLRASVRDLDSAPGRRYAELVLVNATGEPCTVEGFGGMQLLDSTRNPVPTKLVRLTRPAARPVVLDPGAAAVSEISFSVVATDADRPKGACQPRPAYALITPPDQEESTRIAWNLGPVCDEGRIEQKSYQPGQA